MDINEIKAAIECILFITGDPVSLKELSTVFDMDKPTLKKIINQMIDGYKESNRGLKIIEIEGSYQFCTKPQYYEYIEKLLRPKANTGLSQASLETLSIIAYNQPITKAKIDGIRGVKSDSCIARLTEKNLIKELGRLETPGRPILYGTGENFLRLFGLKTLEDLPSINHVCE
jgi:segregation and condensation protein B